MVHHFFSTYGLGEKVVHLHADNCSGQNKNRYMMYYLMWRVLTKQHKEITISFLPVGHTKFFPDAGFGMLKRQFQRTKVGCLHDIAEVVRNSAKMNHCQLVGNQRGDVLVPTYDWAEFFVEHTVETALAGIKKIAHFRFCSSSPGAVFVRSASDTPPSKEKKLFFSRIKHGDHNHQMYHLLCHLMGFHYGDNGTFMTKSMSSALLKFRTWYARCQESVYHHPQMKRMNKCKA